MNGRKKKLVGFTLGIAAMICVVSFAYHQLTNQHRYSEARNENLAQLFQAEPNKVFEPVLPDNPVVLPQDFAFHNQFQNEGWSFFANVTDEAGEPYGVQWNYYRLASSDSDMSGWLSPQLFVSHVVVTGKNKVWKEQRVARGGIGQAGMTDRPFRVWIDNWYWRSLGQTPFPGKLNTVTDSFSVELQTTTRGPFVLPGERGYIIKHDLLPVASHNIYAPFLAVQGKIELEKDKVIEVSGEGWMSKEWGSNVLSLGNYGMDWFVFHLDGDTTLSIKRYRYSEQMPYQFGTLSTRSGKVIPLTSEQIVLTPLQATFLGNGKRVPLQWSINIPDHDISLTTQVLNRNLWLPFAISYWEGPIVSSGSHQATGFMQLTGY